MPASLDFLSLDIDGADLWVLRAIFLGGFRPRVVLVEYNSHYPLESTLCNHPDTKWDGHRLYSASLGALNMVADEFGYALVAQVASDLVFVQRTLVGAHNSIPAHVSWRKATRIVLHTPSVVGLNELRTSLVDYAVWRATGGNMTAAQGDAVVIQVRSMGIALLADDTAPLCGKWQPIKAPGSAAEYEQCTRGEDDLMAKVLTKLGYWPDCNILLQLWREQDDPDSIFVDAGANVGSCSLLLAANRANVVAFEPLLANLAIFNESIKRNGFHRIQVHGVGLGAKSDVVQLFTQRSNAGNTMFGVSIPDRDDMALELVNVGHVRIVRLDDILFTGAVPPRIALMKSDVQGFELHLLAGASRLLRAGAIAIIKAELAGRWLEAQGSTGAKLCAKLEEWNFVVHDARDGTVLRPADCAAMRHNITDVIARLRN